VDLHDIAGGPGGTGGLGEFWADFSAIEIRLAPAGEGAPAPHSASAPRGVWMRVVDPLPDDPLIHQGALAYASDLMLMSTAVTPHGHRSGEERDLAAHWHAVSLDHTIWLRRPVRIDEWTLFEHTTPMAQHSRVLIEVAVFDGSGDVVGQIAQEALIRSREGSAA
jgi:acyl-CoA thioesterase-2